MGLKIIDGTPTEMSKFLRENKEKIKPIILDDNELSILAYAEEYPENWKKICEQLKKKREECGEE